MATTTNVRVSYLISTRNRAEYLARTLENLAEIITPDDELLIMDGGSTDHTAAVVERFRTIVTSFTSEPDHGEAHGYNKGLLAARGRYFKLITDDDYTFPEGMRAAIALLEGHPEIDALYCGGERWQLNPASGEQTFHSNVQLPVGLRLADGIENILEHTACGLGLILTRKVLARVGVFDISFRAVDVDMLTRLISCGADFRYADIKLFRHYTYPHSAQNANHIMLRDWVRALLRAGRWDLIPQLSDSGRPICDAVGLSRLKGGRALGQLILCGELVRRSAFRGLLNAAAIAQSPLVRCYRALRGRGAATKPVTIATPIAPEWDGSLR
ncbi:MAG: glycosyltransferase [Planctomycetota bacterium]